MNAIEFAIENSGRLFEVPKACLSIAVLNELDNRGLSFASVYGQVVGHFNSPDGMVVVELKEKLFRKLCWPKYEDVTITIQNGNLFDQKEIRLVSVHPKMINYSSMEYHEEVIEVVKAPPAYPSICKYCNSPARKIDKLIVCSKRNCNSRRDLVKTYDIKYSRTNVILCPADLLDGIKNHQVVIKKCKKRAVHYWGKTKEGLRTFNTPVAFEFACEDQHRFKIQIEDMKVNDIVMFSLSDGEDNDRIWNGKKWERY